MTEHEADQDDPTTLRGPGTELRLTGRPHEVSGFISLYESGPPQASTATDEPEDGSEPPASR